MDLLEALCAAALVAGALLYAVIIGLSRRRVPREIVVGQVESVEVTAAGIKVTGKITDARTLASIRKGYDGKPAIKIVGEEKP